MNQDMSILSLVMQASLVVQLVMALLLGVSLVSWSVIFAKAIGLRKVRDDNAAAKALYARAGFEVLDVRRRYYQPGDVDALVLRATLRKDRDD